MLPEPERESGQRRSGPDAIRPLEVLAVAKRAGFTLDESRVLLQRTEADDEAATAPAEARVVSMPRA
ncbi:MAG: hypothetical protein M3295_02440 [Chloroflexota bacterium]|nr:hypothetical protein [Chloroflexota bacterium]